MIRCQDLLTVDGHFLKIFLIVLTWQLCGHSAMGYSLDYGKIGQQQLSNVWPELNVPNAYSGELYQTKIASSNLTKYDIRFLVSKVGSQDLPTWLEYSDQNYSLAGLPFDSDVGLHQLFVLAVRLNKTTSNTDLLGAQTFEISVVPSENRSYCDKGVTFVVTEVSLAVNGSSLNSTQRIQLYQWFAMEFDGISSIYFEQKHEPENSSLTGCEVLEKYEANTSYVGPVLSISWLVGCDLNVSLTNTSDKISEAILDYPLFAWRTLSGNDSTVCFPNIHKSTGVSSIHHSTDVVMSTSQSALIDLSRTTYLHMSVFGNKTVYSTSANILSSSLKAQTISRSNSQSTSINTTSLHPSFRPTHVLSRTLTANSTSLFKASDYSNVYEMTLSTETNSLRVKDVTATISSIAATISHSITPTRRNSDPVVLYPLPTINITSCQYLYFEIPDNTFWDREDGNTKNLTLRLLTKNLRDLPIDSWVNLDPTDGVIYGVPVVSQLFTINSTRVYFEYMLSAVDSGGRAINTSVTLTVYDDQTPTGQQISIEVNSQSAFLNPLQLIQLISAYLYGGDNSTMKILQLNQSSPKALQTHLRWGDCKAVSDVCDVTRVERTSRLIRIDENYLNPHFVVALVPNFVLFDARAEKLGKCLNEPPLATRNVVRINVTCCGKFRYEIPRDLFYDKEDGETRNLSLTIRFTSASRLHCYTCFALNDTSKTLEGIIFVEEAQKYPDGHFEELFIVATDSGKREANVSVLVTVRHPLPVSNYFVSLFLQRLHSFSTHLQEAFLIIDKLTSYFDAESSDEIRVISYTRENAVTVFTWSLADLAFKPCDLDAIANISGKLKGTDGEVNDGFQLAMGQQFEVQYIFEERLGHCKEGANEQPTVNIPLHHLRLNLTYFEYIIPAVTFSDLEDGNTRNLKLSLLSPLFEALPVDSWITLDSERQIIYGLPDEDAIRSQPTGGYRYLLVGQDNGGKVASSSVVVELLKTTTSYNYQITAQLRSYLEASLPCVDHVVEFLKKLSTFIGEDEDNIRIVSYNISKTYPADVTISWTNRTAGFNTCDHETIRKRFEEFKNDEIGVTKSFSDILLPYFIVQDIKLEFRETCDVFPNTPPVLLSPVETLNIPLYQVLQFQLPADMFYDKEDGYTRNLTVTALDKDYQPLNFSSWIQFDPRTQLLYGLPTSTVAKQQPTDGHVINIVAMDTDSSTVSSTTRIVIGDTKPTVNYLVKINMVVNTSREYSDIDTVLNFLRKVDAFLENYETIVTEYFRENTTLKVWISTLNFLGIECNLVELEEISHHLLVPKAVNASEVGEGKNSSTEPSSTTPYPHPLTISTGEMVSVQPTFVSPTNTRSIQPTVNTKSVSMDRKTVSTSVLMAANEPNENFTRAMLPEFLISSVTEHKTGPCSNKAPVVLELIPHLVISTHGSFSIVLPLRTFYDAEDGFATNLSIVLLSSSGQDLPPNSWIQFNDTSYELYGVVASDATLNANYTFILKAEDIHGLEVNTSFTTEVSLRLQNVGLKLNMIFRSNFSSVVPHVDIIKRLLTKIKSYYNTNITINVLSFERGSGVPSTDILSWSVPELNSENCDLEQLHEISEKVRFSNNQPNEEFQHALLPEFDLLAVFEQRLGSCSDNLNNPPTVTVPALNLNIRRVPTVFHYIVPRNVFDDPEDGDTRNLTLTLLSVDNQQILGNSSIQLDAPLQTLYGIFTERDLISRVTRFVLRATDSGGKTATSVLEIILGNDVSSQNYELHLTFISYLSSTSPDVTHLINFQEKLRGFQGLRDLQVASYVRFPGYPAKFDVRFINSSNLNQSFCDFAEISKITEIFQDSSSNLKIDFTTSFLPEFVVQVFHVQRLGPCKNLPNTPPIVNRIIPVINTIVCEILKFQVPEDVFLDEDGNTRNLSLKLEVILPEGRKLDWMFLDVRSQMIYAVPSLNVHENQPSEGYRFRLTATDSQGESAELDFTVLVRDVILRDSYRLTVVVRVPSLLITTEDLVQKTIDFVEATKRYLTNSSTSDIRVIEFGNVSQSLLKVTWSNCSLRYTPCDYRNIEKIRQATIYAGTLPQPRFIQFLAPAFIVDSVEDEMRGPCLNQRPWVRCELDPLNLTLCDGLFQYSIPYNTFFDEEDGYTPNLTLSILTSSSMPLSQNYWLTIDASQTIIAYPNVDALKTQPESGYEILLNARDSNGLSTSLAMKVLYQEDLPQSTYEVTLVLRAQFGNLTRSVDQVRGILQTLARYIGGSERTIRVHSFQRAGMNSTTSFFTWSNCSFPPSGCDLLGIMEISKRLKNNDDQISEQLKTAFRPNFEVKFVFEQRLGACKDDTNIQPNVKHPLYQVMVENFCGFWQFEIPPDFFYDVEDGGTRNLTLSLKTIDSLEIPADSWVQFEQETQTLYGFPSLSNSRNSSIPTREAFILIAADSQGKLATMRLEVIFNKKIPNVHYGVTVEMSSYVGESRPDVYHLKTFVERLALFLKVETEAIMVTEYRRKTTGTSSRFTVTWTNCTAVVNTCDANQISIIRENLNLDRDEVDMAFSQSMLPYFVPNSITLKKFGLCKIAAMKSPPRLLRPIGRIVAYSGSLLWYTVPQDIFVDQEDGNALNLSLVLQFNNKVVVPASYWLKFDNISLVISGVSLENAWENSFRLVAHDQHGNEAVDTFEVFLEQKCPENLLSYQVFSEVVYTGNEENLNEIFLRKLEVYFKPWFIDRNFTLVSITRKVQANNTFLIVWSHARTCGVCFEVNTTLQALSENITDSNGTALQEFMTALLPEFTLVNTSEAKCRRAPGVPITIIKGGKEYRWKLYVVPIIVLLIFLLFSFVFFICRTFVFPYESKKDEVILDESPVGSSPREIHVTERIRASEASMYNSGTNGSTTVVNEGFLGSSDVIDAPEIFLDKRVSPSKSSLPQDDSSPVSPQDVEPSVVPTPPMYSAAVLHLAGRKPGESKTPSPTSRIELREIPIIKREVAPSSEAIPVSQTSEIDGRHIPRKSNERLRASPYNDTRDTFNDDEYPIPVRNRLRLPTPPEVGLLRLPPVPKPLGNTPVSPLSNTPVSPLGNTPNSPPSSAYSTPLLTPNYSQTTVNNTYNVREIRTPPEIPTSSPNGYPNPPAYAQYPYGTPMRERTQLGVQSPLGFPFPRDRVPYVDHRQQEPPVDSKPTDLHEVLGQLRETVNRELDRRNDVDKYLDSYFNNRK